MFDENLSREIIRELEERYPSPESRKNLRLNDNLIVEIFQIAEYKGYELTPIADFSTENFSATALAQFEEPIRQWVQTGSDFYIPSEQMLRDLISQGWIIKPPAGV